MNHDQAMAALRGRIDKIEVNVPLTEQEVQALLWIFNGWLRQKVEEMDTATTLTLLRELSSLYPPLGDGDDASVRHSLLRAFGVEKP